MSSSTWETKHLIICNTNSMPFTNVISRIYKFNDSSHVWLTQLPHRTNWEPSLPPSVGYQIDLGTILDLLFCVLDYLSKVWLSIHKREQGMAAGWTQLFSSLWAQTGSWYGSVVNMLDLWTDSPRFETAVSLSSKGCSSISLISPHWESGLIWPMMLKGL